MQLIGGKRAESWWLYALAGALMIAGPVWRELYVNQYPARPEAFVLPLMGGILGAFVAAGSRLAGGLVGTVVFGGLLFVFTDLQFDLHQHTYTALLLVGCIVVALLLASHRAAICALGLGAFFLSSLARPSIALSAVKATVTGGPRPTYMLVHIILDEQWGIGGLRAAGDTATSAFLTDFYLQRGFELHESAYSRDLQTTESIPRTLSLGQAIGDLVERKSPYNNRMIRNPLFDRLHQLQYDLRVYESTFLDFCSSEDIEVSSCEVQSANSIRNFASFEGGWMARGVSAGRFFLNTRSHVYNRLFPERTSGWRRSVAGGGLAAMRHLTDAIAARRNEGTVYFVHVLLPHRPVQTDEECGVLPSPQLGYDVPGYSSDSLWRSALRYYGGQVRCAHRALASVIDAIDGTVGRDQSILVVHGDHGSRLHRTAPAREALAAYTLDQLNSNFSTLLAVRRPNVPAALHREPIPVQDAIWELARSDYSGPLPKTWQHYLRQPPDSLNEKEVVRPLTTTDMLWVRRTN